MNKEIVLVTGISGWIAQYCAIELIKAGYHVRGSLRSMERQQEVIDALSKKLTQPMHWNFVNWIY